MPWGDTNNLNHLWIIHGARPPIPQVPDEISEELASALPLWWDNDQSRRVTSQEVMAFFECPTIQVQ